jgi:hypothetical protein
MALAYCHGIIINFVDAILTPMKKKLSALGILLILMLKYPPLPKYSLFHKIEIVQVCKLSIRQLALQFHSN